MIHLLQLNSLEIEININNELAEGFFIILLQIPLSG